MMQVEDVEPEMRTILLLGGCDYNGCAPQDHTLRLVITVLAEDLGMTLSICAGARPCFPLGQPGQRPR